MFLELTKDFLDKLSNLIPDSFKTRRTFSTVVNKPEDFKYHHAYVVDYLETVESGKLKVSNIGYRIFGKNIDQLNIYEFTGTKEPKMSQILISGHYTKNYLYAMNQLIQEYPIGTNSVMPPCAVAVPEISLSFIRVNTSEGSKYMSILPFDPADLFKVYTQQEVVDLIIKENEERKHLPKI